jgi:cellulose synthase/poly-beta-1,6-N-acetylglucosamine synthase-like glycosyltransferase
MLLRHVSQLEPDRISLVATVYNEAESIGSWLESVEGQSRTPDEIVIVDAGSTDGTRPILARLQDAGRLRFVVELGANVPRGRNRAISEARFPVIAVTDAGTKLDPDWLANLTAPLSDSSVSVVGGFFRPAGRTAFEGVLAAVITPQEHEIDPRKFLPSSRSIAFLKSAWQKVGGYPEWLRAGEDLVFDMKLREAGFGFAFAPRAVVEWYPRPTLREFFRQYRHYARGDGHGFLWPKRHVVRYSSYILGVVLMALGRRRPWLLATFSGGFAIYMQKFVRRLWQARPLESTLAMWVATGLVPVIVVVGDVAKMVGLPQGLWERWRAGGAEGLEHASIRSHREIATRGSSRRAADTS